MIRNAIGTAVPLRRPVCRPGAGAADWPGSRPVSRVSPSLMLLLAALVAVAALVAALAARNLGGRRQRAVRELLDAADQLEARLRTARAELEAVAGDGVNPVREAMQEMLRQRLWLQQHGAAASVAELDSVRASFNSARQRIDQQLVQIERARAQFG